MMAVTYERVDLSQINFNMFKYDYSDGLYPRCPAITSFSANPAINLGDAIKSSVFKTMLADGIDNMNLYDYNQNVIGSIVISQYITQYVTFEQLNGYSDEQTNTSGYPEYRNTGNATYGIKYKRIYVDPNYAHIGIKVAITLNGTTLNRYLGSSIGAYEIYNQYGTGTTTIAANVLSGGGSYPKTLGLMSRTIGGVEFKYFDVVSLGSVSGEYDWGIDSVERETALLADNLNITEHIVPEVGYMNELDNRFSPRAHSVMTGMYLIYADPDDLMMKDVAKAMFSFKMSDWIENRFFGSDGKDMVIGINWFYGLRGSLLTKDNILGPSDIRIGGSFLRKTDVPDDVISANNLAREFIMWETPELYLNGKYNDYRDYLANYKIYLPYYGFADLDPNDAVNAYIKVYYNINLYSRAADVVITTRSARTNNLEEKIMTLTTTVGEEVPFGADACRNMMTAIAQTAGKAITTGASIALGARGGQIDAAIASNSAANAYDTSMMNASIMSGNNVVDLNAASKGVTDKLSENASLRSKSAGIKAAQNAIPDMPNMALPATNRSNGSGSENGTLDELHPYVMISWPVTCEPNDWEDYVGMPASASTYLTANLGFTQVGAVHPDSMANAPKYLDEIIAQLKAGVYL